MCLEFVQSFCINTRFSPFAAMAAATLLGKMVYAQPIWMERVC